MINIAISTIHRDKNQYIFDSLQSLSLTLKQPVEIKLVVGNPEVKYLENISNDSISIVPITDEDWALAKDKDKCEKFNLNFYRCLSQKFKDNSLGLLYLEDDILFKENWDSKLIEIIEDLKTHTPEFALSLYSAYDLSKQPVDIVQFKSGFYGTQGVFFTNGIIDDFKKKIMNEGILNYRHMSDILLQEYCIEKDIPLYVVKNSLVQHIGVESSIHNNTFHKSVSF